ncbi:MAG TPA: His/Gly/Thr/Pro-type tRNA ligase C-terminal domain-containing protein, partial [Patescibacteria group bacterium]|nr:His/Gly/Thr/Pro-type tRNA ligase C-terminal domain-containing protein [Patescibacteria group bacterium]
PMVEDQGSAAFYGPKIDFVIESSIGREFAISTNQIDLFMGGRFKLKYTDSAGKEATPVIIHRAPLGSHERFIGFLIEHYGGAFPTWLHPVQVAIVPIGDKHLPYAKSIAQKLKEQGIRVEIDAADHTMQAKVRTAEEQKVPYLIIIGDKEVKAKNISLRGRGRKDLGTMTVTDFSTKLSKEIADQA